MKADTVTKDFMSDTSVFADVFNYYVYGGEQVILPECLVERDPGEIALPYGSDERTVPVQRFRDVQKLYAAMTDGKTEYVLYGVENQSSIHYAMAVKNDLYDALDYAAQVEETARSHRKDRKEGRILGKKVSSGEFLGGFWKEDRLIPSVTVTVYFGADEWDGPLSLFDMMDVTDARVLSHMDNYHVRLIAPALMPDEEIMKLQSNLREVLLFIKYSKDKEKIDEILKRNEGRFRDLERRAADVIEVVTNTGLKYDEKEMRVDMCQAIQEMRQESEQIGEKRGKKIGERIGEKRGKKIGERIGEKRGKEIGEQQGELKSAQRSARSFYKMGLKVEQIAEGIGYDVETVKEWLNL